MKRFAALPLAALVFAGACSDSPTAVNDEFASMDEIVITQGVAAPLAPPRKPLLSTVASGSDLGGSTASRLELNGASCSEHTRNVQITFTVTGTQSSAGSFAFKKTWAYDGSSFIGSDEETINVAAQGEGGVQTFARTIRVSVNGQGTGETFFDVEPRVVVKGGNGQNGLNAPDGKARARVYVKFNSCGGGTPPPANTAPVLTVPGDMTVEATGPAGAVASFTVTVTDDHDTEFKVSCNPASGSTFALGSTTVNCSATDSGGLEGTGSFTVNVKDTTAPEISGAPTSPVTLTATGITGANYTFPSITASDIVDGDVTVTCSPSSGALFAIGTTGVTCTATDAATNSAGASFDVTVSFANVQTTLLSPIKSDGTSAFKQGSTVPVKFAAPSYAGGVATDLAGGLHFTLTKVGSTAAGEFVVIDETFSTASNAWRYDNGQYIFNLSTKSLSTGQYKAVIKYAGVILGEGEFGVRK